MSGSHLDLTEIMRFTALLADSAESVPVDTPVPTCPGWTVGDLVWHLTEVQDFWTYIITNRPAGPEDYTQPPRTHDGGLAAELRQGVERLVEALAAADPTATAWTWSHEQTVGFTVRRQIHEALTHCVDGLLTAGQALPAVSPALAADGIDEVVHVMLGNPADDDTGSLRLRATDADAIWDLTIGDGQASVTGTALDLNLWLWGRADSRSLTVDGDAGQLTALRSRLAGNTR